MRPRLAAWSTVVAVAAATVAISTLTTATPVAAASATCPWVGSTAPIPQRVAQVLSRMTVAQEASMVTGSGGSSYTGFTPAIGSLCIPAVDLQDGPAGAGHGVTGVTQLPAPVALASTWDTAAAAQYGQLIGAEQAAKGVTIDLGPTINIVRDPRWGRAFESLSEDPYLAGALGAADVTGVQSTGVMAQVKHLAVYNQETSRNTTADNAIVDTRTLQEIYLPAFGSTVRTAAASSMMCSYSVINGTYACEHPYLLTTALRQQFGFGGFVTSDWGATHSTAPAATAGLDQDMPSGWDIAGAVANGSLAKSTLDTMVSRILTELFAFGVFDNAPVGSPAAQATSAAHVTAARQLAEQGTVLLKNAGGLLPLSTSTTHSIAVIGSDASAGALTQGGGSAQVTSSGTVTPLQGITSRASGATVSFNDGSSQSAAANLAANSDVAIVFASKFEGEGSDLGNIDLSTNDNSLISAVAAANPRTIVVLNTGSAVTMPWLSSVAGVFEAWYPGQEDGNAIAALVFGDVNPSGHLPVTFPTSLTQVPANTTAQWPGSGGKVQYSEALNVGYRWYDTKGFTPLFPFGFGLSYTTFAFSNLHVTSLPRGGAASVSATVTNTGSRNGSDIAQLYVGAPASAGEPPRTLQGFTRVTLAPGASQTVQFPLTERNLHHWNTATSAWTTDTGTYTIRVGDSATNLPLSGSLSVTSAQLGQPVTITNPGPQAQLAGTSVNLPVSAADTNSGQTLTFTANNLPPSTSMTPTGTISGTPNTPGTYTVTVTAADGTGAFASTTFLWTVTPADSGVPTTPLVGNAGLCLDVAGDNSANGTKVEIYACNGTNAQQWTVRADGTVHALGKCLTVQNGGTANGTLVQINDCNGSGAQVWQPQANGALLNPQSGRCLDDPGASTTNGTQVQIFDCNGTAAQKWVSPAGSTSTNLALGRPVTVSSTESASYPGANAVDGNTATRWSSAFSDPQWIQIDLGSVKSITRVVLNWETAYGKAYQVQVSNDASTWTTIFSTTAGRGGVENLTGLSGSGRYLRINGTQRGTQWGYSLWEVEAYS